MKQSQLRSQITQSALWSYVERGGNQIVSFFVFMFVARLIGPSEYGLASICFVVLSFANLIVLGLVDGVISLGVKDDRRLSTIFWLVMGLGVIIALACATSAEHVAAFMGEERIASLLRWLSVAIVFLSASVVPNKLIYAALDFRVVAIRTLFSAALGGVVGITVAFIGGGAFAIIAQQIVSQAIINVIAWSNVRWRPTFTFDLKAIPECMGPGVKATGINIILFFEEQTPRVVIGALLGSVALGYYAFVMRLRFALEELAINPPLAVLFPALCITHGGNDAYDREALLGDMIRAMGWLIFPVVALAIETAPLYVPLAFGPAWSSSVVVLQIALAGSASVPILVTIREALRAGGFAGSYLKLQIVIVGVSLLFSVSLIPFGLEPLVVGIVACCWASVPVYICYIRRWTQLNLWGAVIGLIKPFVVATFTIAMLRHEETLTGFPADGWLRLCATLVFGGLSYLLAAALLHFREAKKLLILLGKLRVQENLS